VTQAAQSLYQSHGLVGGLGTQQAHTHAHAGQTVLLGGTEPGVHGFQHGRQTPLPGMPMAGIEDHVRIAGPVLGQPLAQAVAQGL